MAMNEYQLLHEYFQSYCDYEYNMKMCGCMVTSRHMDSLYFLVKRYHARSNGEVAAFQRLTDAMVGCVNDAALLRLFHSCLSTAPSSVLQLYLLLKYNHRLAGGFSIMHLCFTLLNMDIPLEWLKFMQGCWRWSASLLHWLASASVWRPTLALSGKRITMSDTILFKYSSSSSLWISFISVGWQMALNCISPRWNVYDRLLSGWHGLGGRISAVSLFASLSLKYLGVVCAIHWLVMTLWLILPISKSSFRVDKLISNLALGTAYVFVFIHNENNRTIYKHLFYYTVSRTFWNFSIVLGWKLSQVVFRTLS